MAEKIIDECECITLCVCMWEREIISSIYRHFKVSFHRRLLFNQFLWKWMDQQLDQQWFKIFHGKNKKKIKGTARKPKFSNLQWASNSKNFPMWSNLKMDDQERKRFLRFQGWILIKIWIDPSSWGPKTLAYASRNWRSIPMRKP